MIEDAKYFVNNNKAISFKAIDKKVLKCILKFGKELAISWI